MRKLVHFNIFGFAFGLIACASSDAASPSFGTQSAPLTITSGFESHPVTVGPWPKSLAVADFDRDGIVDAAIGDRDDKTLRILFGDGAGNFAERASTPPLGIDGVAYHMNSADFDADGMPDLVIGDSQQKRVIVLMNRGGRFSFDDAARASGVAQVLIADSARNTNTARPDKVISVVPADYDHDGRVDLAAVSLEDDVVFPYRQTGLSANQTPIFTALPTIDLPAGSASYETVASDVDDDGSLDLVMAWIQSSTTTTSSSPSGSVGVLFGCTSPNFFCGSTEAMAVGAWPYDVKQADLDGDGRTDLVVSNATSNDVSVLLRRSGANRFNASQSRFAVGKTPKYAAIGDFNGDCIPDIIVANYLDRRKPFSLATGALSNGTLTFAITTIAPFDNVASPLAVLTTDIDANGAVDFVFGAPGSSQFVAMKNLSTARCSRSSVP